MGKISADADYIYIKYRETLVYLKSNSFGRRIYFIYFFFFNSFFER